MQGIAAAAAGGGGGCVLWIVKRAKLGYRVLTPMILCGKWERKMIEVERADASAQ